MDILQGQTQFQDTYFVIGDYSAGPYRALRKLDMQVAELRKTMPKEGAEGHAAVALRLANYEALREKIVSSRPAEYWDAGFEAAEEEYWINTLAKKVSLETATTGRPSLPTMEAVTSLRVEAQKAIMDIAASQVTALRSMGVDRLYLGVANGE